MVHVTIWRLRVGTFGTSHVTFSAVKLYSGGGGDRVTFAIRDRPKQGPAVEAAARDLDANSKRWKEIAEVIVNDVPSSEDDDTVLAKFAQVMCEGLPSSVQMHEATSGSTKLICMSVATGNKKKTNEAVEAFDLGKCTELEFNEDFDE